MKQLFENWRKHLTEGGYAGHLDRQQAGWERSMDAAEADRTPEEVFEDDALELAERLGVDISVEVADDGKHIIVVNREEGPEAYNDPDEMYDALSKRDLNESIDAETLEELERVLSAAYEEGLRSHSPEQRTIPIGEPEQGDPSQWKSVDPDPHTEVVRTLMRVVEGYLNGLATQGEM
jgi:hypothetical protein